MKTDVDINSHCAGLYSEWWVAWAPGLGIHGDPGEGRGQRLAAGGQPALGKIWSPRSGIGSWTVHDNR